MPKSIRLFIFSFIFSFLVFFSPLSTYAASPGINIINYVSNAYHVPDDSLKSGPNSWMVYIPNHPSELNPNFITADNVVIRIHAAWTEIGKLMLGTPQQQQQAASDWCSSINSFAQSGKNVYIEPFNELEHDYERISPQGTLDLSTAISRAQNFISLLRSCTSLPITSPALDPQSADFGTTSSAFSNFNIISCHPYRMDTLERCKSIANGKQLIFTEIGVDKGGVKYDDCLFIEFFCDEGFIEALQNTPNLIAYFLFTVSPGNYAGFWQLTNPSVIKALKGECAGDLTCETTPIEEIVQMIEKVYQHTHLGKMAPFIGRSDRNNGIRPGPLTNTATGLLNRILASFNFWWVKYFTPAFSHIWPFHYTDLFSEQYAEDACPISGDICSSETLYNIKQADWEIVDDLYTLRQDPTVGVLTKYAPQTDGHNPTHLRQSLNYFGPGWMFSLYNYPKYLQNPVEKQQNDRDFFDFKSGVYSRVSSAQKNDDDQVNDFLCKLACSGDTDCINRHPNMVPAYDAVIAYLKVTEDDFKERFPNASYGIGDLDRSQAEGVDDPIPIRLSNLFCFNPDAISMFLNEKCAPKYGPINPNICDRTPDWMQQPAMEGFYYGNVWPRAKQYVAAMNNQPSKAFWETCQEQDEENCQANNPFSQAINVQQDFCHLSVDTRTNIIDDHDSTFSKSAEGRCYACKVEIIYFPNLTRTTQYTTMTSQQTTPLKSHPKDSQTSTVIDIYYDNKSIKHDDPRLGLGADNRNRIYNEEDRSTLWETAMAFLTRNPLNNNVGCTINYVTEEETDADGNITTDYVPTNSCHVRIESIIKINLCMPSDFYQLYDNSKNFTSHLTPNQANQTIDQTIKDISGSDLPIGSIEASYAHTNNLGGIKSPQAMHDSGEDLSGTQSLGKDPIKYGPNNENAEQVQQRYFLPVSWQSQL